MNTKRLLTALATAMLLVASGMTPAQADDTDIYLKSSQVTSQDAPKVMLIFDNSGSMDSNVSNTRPAYDSSTDYLAIAGAPADIQSGRVYWSLQGGPPATDTDQWFNESALNCQTGTSILASDGEVYVDITLRHEDTNSDWQANGWKSLKGGVTDQTVDCYADRGTGSSTSDSDGYLVVPNNPNKAYGNNASNEIAWNAYSDLQYKPMLYSANFMAYYYHTGLTPVTRTRVDIAKEAVKRIINANPTMHFGLMVFNDNDADGSHSGGRVIMPVGALEESQTYAGTTQSRRQHLHDQLDGLAMNTYTPLAETLWEAYRYFGGLAPTYGGSTSHATDPVNPVPNPCAEDSTGCTHDGTYESALKYACQKAYVILMTDGAPTRDTEANSMIDALPNMGSVSNDRLDELAGWMNNYDINPSLTNVQTVNTYTIGFGSGIDATLLQNTATRGGGDYYNADDSVSLTDAFQAALAKIREVNTSFTAPALSVNAFNKLYNRDEIYFALFKPSDQKRWNGNLKKYTLCNTADVADASITCSYGDILDVDKVRAIDQTTNRIKLDAKSYWSTASDPADGPNVTSGGAGKEIQDLGAGNRVVYTYFNDYSLLTTGTAAQKAMVQVDTTDGSAYMNAVTPVKDDATTASYPDKLGLAPVTDITSATEVNAKKAEVVTMSEWILGKDVYDSDADSDITEARWAFQDPLHSRPVAISFGAETSGGSYDYDRPVTKLFIGTNDGGIRMINDYNGKEEWVFVPKEMMTEQHSISQNADGSHIYGMDNTATFWINDVNSDGIIDQSAGDHVYMYVSQRRGGNHVYAFDVTPASILTSRSSTTGITPRLMWVIEGGSTNYARLGQTWSIPLVATVREKCTTAVSGSCSTGDTQERKVLLFGGGYDVSADAAVIPPAGMGNAIFMVDPETGNRLWWASSDSSADLVLGDMGYPIPSELAMIDTNYDGAIDRIYVGDISGQVWRIDLDPLAELGGGTKNARNGSTSGYVFADLSCARTGSNTRDCSSVTGEQYRRFHYPPDIAQVRDPAYSTIADYDMIAIGSGNRADPLDFLTKGASVVPANNRVYALRDYNWQTGYFASNALPDALVNGDLYNATGDPIGTATTQADMDTEIATLKGTSGWYVELKESSAPSWTTSVPPGISTPWIGEKNLSKPVIYDGVLYFTTFVPANPDTTSDACSAAEGTGKLYALNYLNATAEIDLDGDNTADYSTDIGGGIPSELVTVIREGGVTKLVGTSGGAAGVGGTDQLPRGKTYWYEG